METDKQQEGKEIKMQTEGVATVESLWINGEEWVRKSPPQPQQAESKEGKSTLELWTSTAPYPITLTKKQKNAFLHFMENWFPCAPDGTYAHFDKAFPDSKEESQQELWEELDRDCTDCNCSLIIEKAKEQFTIIKKTR